ncbi:restriction endonuclease subunit S [Micromonospora tulbaghiae]|uniref:restriction endonuclease subunit S n=1 Tax=Micromonospora tulbaghiae TaxID=479978 RepID=UPI003425F01B
MTFPEVKLKRILSRSDAGAWGMDPGVGTGNGVPVLRSTEISMGGVINSEGAAIRTLSPREVSTTRLLAGDLVVVKSSGSDAHLGKTGIVTRDLATDTFSFSNFLQRLRVSKRCDPRFVWYFLNSLLAKRQVRLLSSTSTGLQNLSASLIGELVMPFPPIEEQRRIAEFLDATTRRIAQVESGKLKQLAALDERCLAEVSECVTPGILTRPAGASLMPWLPKLPSNIPLVRLGFVCRLQSGLTVDGTRKLTGDVVTRPYLRVANVQAGHFRLESVTEVTVPRAMADRTTLQLGDVLMTEGGDLDKLGRGAVWRGELENCLHQNHIFALRPDARRLDGEYLALVTQSLHGRCYFESTGAKTTNLASTNSSKILGLPLPLPSLDVQRGKVRDLRRSLDSTERVRNLIKQQVRRLRERREVLIAGVFEGQIGVGAKRD